MSSTDIKAAHLMRAKETVSTGDIKGRPTLSATVSITGGFESMHSEDILAAK